jgi:hypothetical protein
MLIQAYAGLDAAEATAWVRVGAALRPEVSLLGEVLPARHPAVVDALARGELRVGTADRVLATVHKIEPYSSLDERQSLERILVDEAAQVTDRQFAITCAEVLTTFQPENTQRREAFLRSKCGVWQRLRGDGITETTIRSRGEDTGFITLMLDSQTAPRRQVAIVPAGEEPTEHDRRPLTQRRLDALVVAARSFIGSDQGKVAGCSVTLRVTMSLDELKTGLGSTKIDGYDHAISAADARRLAADADIIPVVLGSDSVPLDMGRTVRLATESQRDAVAIRDGGCTWQMCDKPPGWCEMAHIVPWVEGGSTDLDNLILLCPFHHRCFDNDGWELATIEGERYFIPPAWVDPDRRPRPAGKRHGLAA